MVINKLRIKNFKCFSDIAFELGNLNLLAGSNGCGKSSVIQALLLLRQSFEQYGSLNMLSTYGKYVNLGLAGDILYDYAENENEKISFELNGCKGNNLKLEYSYIPEKSTLKNIEIIQKQNYKYNLFCDKFEFLSADRISPQTTYSIIDQSNTLGIHGENAINYLEQQGADYMVDEVFWDGTGNKYLLYYVNQWLEKLFSGFNLYSNRISEADAVSLRYKEKSRDMVGNAHRAVNVGYGITYVLPVIIALLKARKDDLIILENPEAHLHPKAQRLIGELLVKAAATGAQIMLETHSDHILNGIRISVKKNYIEADKVKLFFFLREDVGARFNVNVYSPVLNQKGDIDILPEGFFDEWDNALAELF